MKPANNHSEIIEKLLILIIIIIAIVLSIIGGMIFNDLDNSTVWTRVLALPGLDASLILGHGHAPQDVRAAVYIGGFFGYFLLGLLLLSLIRDAIKKYRDKKGGGTRI